MHLPWHKARIAPEELEEAQAALAAATEHLEEARARDAEVHAVAGGLYGHRTGNNFTERFFESLWMEGRRRHAGGH